MERDAIVKRFLDAEGRLKALPAKQAKKLCCLKYLAALFEAGRSYTEGEVNDIINAHTVFQDPATVRRELYNNRFLGRESDGSRYWLERDPDR